MSYKVDADRPPLVLPDGHFPYDLDTEKEVRYVIADPSTPVQELKLPRTPGRSIRVGRELVIGNRGTVPLKLTGVLDGTTFTAESPFILVPEQGIHLFSTNVLTPAWRVHSKMTKSTTTVQLPAGDYDLDANQTVGLIRATEDGAAQQIALGASSPEGRAVEVINEKTGDDAYTELVGNIDGTTYTAQAPFRVPSFQGRRFVKESGDNWRSTDRYNRRPQEKLTRVTESTYLMDNDPSDTEIWIITDTVTDLTLPTTTAMHQKVFLQAEGDGSTDFILRSGTAFPIAPHNDDPGVVQTIRRGQSYKLVKDGATGVWVEVGDSMSDGGSSGLTWRAGGGELGDEEGGDGEFYLRMDDPSIYYKAAGVWTRWLSLGDDGGGDGGGPPINIIDTDAGVPDDGIGVDTDYYHRTDVPSLYYKVAGTWGVLALNDGAAPINIIAADAGVPDDGIGVEEDYYIRTDVPDIYIRYSGIWISFSEQGGGDGLDAIRIFDGPGAPDDGDGDDGEYYLRVDLQQLYGPKNGGSWGSPFNLAGADGADWAPGVLRIAQDESKAVAPADGVTLVRMTDTDTGSLPELDADNTFADGREIKVVKLSGTRGWDFKGWLDGSDYTSTPITFSDADKRVILWWDDTDSTWRTFYKPSV